MSNRTWIERGAQNLADVWQHCAAASNGRWTQFGAARVADAGSLCPFLNSTVLTRPIELDEIGRLTEDLDAFYARADGGSWLLWTASPMPDLSPLGYANWGQPPLMLRPVGGEAPPPPPELRIVEVMDADRLVDFETAFIEGYPLHWLQPARPGSLFDTRVLGGPLRLWLGLVADRPVSVAASFESADIVGVHMVATRPEARGRGYGAALTWQATRAKPQVPAMLQASDQGRPLYERMGYITLTRMTLWERHRVAMSHSAGR
jgi:hypothetical protein